MGWDVFISHAHEDKDSFVRPLANELRENGLQVWYDEFTLQLGDSLNESINKGLADSQFGIVVLSRSFFEKKWPKRELDGLVAREIEEGKVILPLWHGVSRDEVFSYSPILADRVAVDTSRGVTEVVKTILATVRPLPAWVLVSTQRSLNNLRHEIMSPVDGILAHIEWMEGHMLRAGAPSAWDTDRVRLKFEDIKQAARLIEVLVATMGSAEADITLRIGNFHLARPIQACIGFVQNEARRKGVRIHVEGLWVSRVQGDELQLARVFYNLLRNAIKYSDPAEPDRFVRISASEDGDSILLLFEDNGIGVVRGEEEVIFQRFSRGSNASKVSPDGSGLGLYYSRAIIRKHGGSIGIDPRSTSKPTVLAIRLPKRA
jgi:signal transduction histidine kinase